MSHQTYLFTKAQRSLKDHRDASNAALVGAGSTTAGVGLAAGGIPGVRANHSAYVGARSKPEQERVRNLTRRQRTAEHVKGVKATPGGILGFRMSAHRGATYGFKQDRTLDDWRQPGGPLHDPRHPQTSAHHAYSRGWRAGRVEPEEKVLRHMGGAKKVAGLALVGGTGTAAYGALRDRKRVKKDDRTARRRAGALAGTGAAASAITYGGTAALQNQAHRWQRKATKNREEAGRLVPKIAGRSGEYIQDHPSLFRGVGPHVARQAGEMRGNATQQAHFAHVYRDTGKIVGHFRTPSAVAAGAGLGGLAALKTRDKKRVKKALHIPVRKLRLKAKAPAVAAVHPRYQGKLTPTDRTPVRTEAELSKARLR